MVKSFQVVFLLMSLCNMANSYAQPHSGNDSASYLTYQRIAHLPWKEIFFDSFEKDWRTNWFLDGKKATISNGKEGMDFYGGPEARQDADHAVLWTNRTFSGNLRIEYDYTRLDSATKFVTIFYLLAEGSGKSSYEKDIRTWSNLREIPSMKLYFEHMNAYHISYAAFENDNPDPENDYIRTRRYLPERGLGLKGTEVLPDYARTGLFQPGILYHITIILKDSDLFMQVRNAQRESLFHWKTDQQPPVLSGRLGLRHMCTRAARYHNLIVYSY